MRVMVHKKMRIVFVLVLFFLGTGGAQAESMTPEKIKTEYPKAWESIYTSGKQAGKKEAEAMAAAKTAPPSMWWLDSSRAADGKPEQWRFHAELDYGYTNLFGNDDGYVHRGSGKLALRRWYLTNWTTYSVNRADIEQSDGGSLDKDTQLFENAFQWDFTKRLFAQAGFMWERDISTLVNNRMIGYLGMGMTVVRTEPVKVNLYLSGGHQDESYSSIVNSLIGVSGRSTPIVYFLQTLSWRITDRLTLREGFRVLYDMDEEGEYDQSMTPEGPVFYKKDEENRIRQRLKVDLEYRMAPHLSLFWNFKDDHDTTPWPGVKDTDTRNTFGIRFHF